MCPSQRQVTPSTRADESDLLTTLVYVLIGGVLSLHTRLNLKVSFLWCKKLSVFNHASRMSLEMAVSFTQSNTLIQTEISEL